MKTFDEYVDGETVTYKNRYGNDNIFKAYKSQYTYNAFRLKNHTGEVVADITEIEPCGARNEKPTSDFQRSSGHAPTRYIDSDADASGFYDVHDVQD